MLVGSSGDGGVTGSCQEFNVGGRNRMWVLCKSSTHPYLLSHLLSLNLLPFGGGVLGLLFVFSLFLAQEVCSFTGLGMIGRCFPGSPWFISFSYEVYSYALEIEATYLPSLYMIFLKSFFYGVF